MEMSCWLTALLENRSVHHVEVFRVTLKLNSADCQALGAAFKGNDWLESLRIASICVLDTGSHFILDGLLDNTTLRNLTLNQMDISTAEAGMICTILQKNSSLERLCLSNNPLGEEGLGMIAEALVHNRSLKELILESVGATPKAIRDLSKALMHNRTLEKLDLSLNGSILVEDGPQPVAELLLSASSLKVLRINGMDLFRKDDKRRLEHAKALRDALKHNTSLRKLDLASTSTDTTCCKLLLEALQENSSLHKLDLASNWLRPGGLVTSLKGMVVLRHLDLSRNCDLDNVDMGAIAEMLATNGPLEQLTMSRNEISPEGIQMLARALEVNTTLTSLNLRETGITPPGAEAMASALSVNCTLRSLNLAQNDIGRSGALALAKAIAHNASLDNLDVSLNLIENSGSKALAISLLRNTTLASLNVKMCGVKDSAATCFAKMLRINTSLTSLELQFNKIQDEGVRQVMDALATNTTLRALDVVQPIYAYTGDVGASAESMLSSNTTLESLKVCLQFLPTYQGDSNMRFANGLRNNRTLRTLCVMSAVYGSCESWESCPTVHNDALEIIQAIKDTPRMPPIRMIECSEFGVVAHTFFFWWFSEELGMPPWVRMWGNEHFVAVFHDEHLQKLLAWSMGQNQRLGAQSLVHLLRPDMMMAVFNAYFGITMLR